MPLYPVVDFLQDYAKLLDEKRLVAEQLKSLQPIECNTSVDVEPKTIEEKIMVFIYLFVFWNVKQLPIQFL